MADDRRYPLRPILGVAAIILDRDRILMVERGQPPLQGYWSLPGGALETGETLEEGLRREILEETGLEIHSRGVVQIFERIMRDAAGRPEYHYVIVDYLCRVTGATLDPKELLDLFHFLDVAADVRSILNAVAERFPRMGARGRAIGEFRPLLKDLEGKILPDGSIADHASVALARIRRDIERQKKSIQSSLERFLRTHQEEGILQEEFV